MNIKTNHNNQLYVDILERGEEDKDNEDKYKGEEDLHLVSVVKQEQLVAVVDWCSNLIEFQLILGYIIELGYNLARQ